MANLYHTYEMTDADKIMHAYCMIW